MSYAICYAPDNKYVNLTVVSMISVCENNKDKLVDFIILYSDLTEDNINKLSQLEREYSNCTVKFITINEKEFDKFPIPFWVSVQTWFRMKIADLCTDINKILYLDCDTLCVAPLDELFDINIENYLIAGITDVWGGITV